MESENKHVPVMLTETIEALQVKDNGVYIDLTLGGGGHFNAILNKLNKGILIGIDKDEQAIKDFNIKDKGSLKILLINDNYVNLSDILHRLKIEKVDGILADLGLATYQYESNIGLSYKQDALLDMRMDKNLTVSASDLLNGLYQKELEKMFELSDIAFAKNLAKQIIKHRQIEPIIKTTQLTSIVQKIVPFKYRKGTNKHPEAKVFQALRIAVNHELVDLKQLLPQAFEALAPDGRLVIISFHSGEDRIVKSYFKELTENGRANFIFELKRPALNEINLNKRSHSAKLRAIRKI